MKAPARGIDGGRLLQMEERTADGQFLYRQMDDELMNALEGDTWRGGGGIMRTMIGMLIARVRESERDRDKSPLLEAVERVANERDEARAIAAQAVGERQAAEHNAREARRTEALAWLKTVGAGEEYLGIADKLTEHGRRGAFDSGTLAASRAMTERLLADALVHVATLESQVAELNRELAEAVAKTKAPF